MQADDIQFKTILSYFWKVIHVYRWSFVGSFVLMGAGKVLSGTIVPIYYGRLIDSITATTNRPDVSQEVLGIVLLLAVSILLYNIFYRLAGLVITYFQTKGIKALNDFSFRELQKHSYHFFTNTFAGSLVAKQKRYVRAFEDLHDQAVFSFWMIIIQLVGTFIVLFTEHVWLGTLFLGWTAVYIVLSVLLTRKVIPYSLDAAEKDSLLTAQLSDVLTNILNVKIFASRKQEEEAFAKVTTLREISQRRLWNFNMFMEAVQAVFMMILEVGGMYLAVRLWLAGSISGGIVVLVQIYIGIIVGTLWNLGRSISRTATAVSDAAEMVEVFEKEVDIKDPKNPRHITVTSGTVTFDNVSFAYVAGSDVLRNFCLEIDPKQKVGLVGASGAGKSTISKLLLRFVDITEGSIRIDGQDIREASQDALRRLISFVPQEPILFHRTLRENIAYAKPDASMEDIIAVAKKARAHEFITSFPDGYDTLVGERGVKLSGGERQRIAIARAMLENAPILMLDEATSSLDSVSESAIQAAFEELLASKTAIVIAHRLSTIRKMDRIIVMDAGAIVEDGSHEKLLDQKGWYYNLWQHQQDGFIGE